MSLKFSEFINNYLYVGGKIQSSIKSKFKIFKAKTILFLYLYLHLYLSLSLSLLFLFTLRETGRLIFSSFYLQNQTQQLVSFR